MRAQDTVSNLVIMDAGTSTEMPGGVSDRSNGWVRTVVIGRNPKRTLIRIVVLVSLCFLIREFVLLPIRVIGPSMLPTYKEGGINFVNRLAYLRSGPQRGDVVAIRLSNRNLLPPSIMFLKRIVGLPGERIEFHGGHLFINGNILDEPYVKRRWDWNSRPLVLESNQYYVVGDNRSMPEAYHEEGRARADHIVGKILL